MPKFKQANIWDDFNELDYICVTTNATLKFDSTLIMGAGCALEAKQKEPNLPYVWGNALLQKNLVNKLYGLLSYDKFIAFQTKIYWKNPSTEEIINFSVDKLNRLALKYPNKIFGLPYPGISNGKLSKKIVYPLIKDLPDNVIIYSLS